MTAAAPHIPVLIRPLIAGVSPVSGHWVDGTFGAGGYARAMMDAGADHVTGIDRDPLAHDLAAAWLGDYDGRMSLKEGCFGDMDTLIEGPVDGVMLDLGVSSMQLDRADRGFSFMKDGPLDMRMGQAGVSAADIVNGYDADDIADILFQYGEERQSRRIARAIVKARDVEKFHSTLQLAEVISNCLPRPKPNQSHPATRSFQGLRIAVNDEFGELIRGLEAAERLLRLGGALAVVSFHSLEDRVVKRFFQSRTGQMSGGNRYQPEVIADAPSFRVVSKKSIAPDAQELEENPRSRSSRLRIGFRTEAPAQVSNRAKLGLPKMVEERR
ncbi:MAG: 16S rRNA (cytosine(1402)-N(4))-methyltransferase RsmH [Halocynthiibacter sp.]